jgi:hypothetical protein
MQLGFDKFKLLIDMSCYLPFSNGEFWYSSEDFLKNGRIQSQILYVFDKVEQDNVIIQDFNTELHTNVKQICENLYMVTRLSPSEKHIERIKQGIIYKEPERIL